MEGDTQFATKSEQCFAVCLLLLVCYQSPACTVAVDSNPSVVENTVLVKKSQSQFPACDLIHMHVSFPGRRKGGVSDYLRGTVIMTTHTENELVLIEDNDSELGVQ